MIKLNRDDIANLLKDVNIHIHIHNEPEQRLAHQIEQVQLLNSLLSRSTSKLKHALAIVETVRSVLPLENLTMKSALDQAIADLTETVTAQTSVIESAVTFINGVPALIQKAHDDAVAAGATPQQLGAVSALAQNLKDESAKLQAALTANTEPPAGGGTTDPPAGGGTTDPPIDPNNP